MRPGSSSAADRSRTRGWRTSTGPCRSSPRARASGRGARRVEGHPPSSSRHACRGTPQPRTRWPERGNTENALFAGSDEGGANIGDHRLADRNRQARQPLAPIPHRRPDALGPREDPRLTRQRGRGASLTVLATSLHEFLQLQIKVVARPRNQILLNENRRLTRERRPGGGRFVGARVPYGSRPRMVERATRPLPHGSSAARLFMPGFAQCVAVDALADASRSSAAMRAS